MPLDPQVKRFLNAVHLAGLTPWYLLSAREVRDGFETGTSKCLSRAARAVNKEDRLIPSPFCSIPIRIYRPENQEAGPSPALVFYHGGGFVIGSIDTHDTICHEVCSLTGMTVISAGYRRAPEHKFPAPMQDAYTAFDWVFHNASSLNVDPNRIGLFGDSAGACLCCQVSLLAHDMHGPRPSCQGLLYPMIDYYLPGTQSYLEKGTGYNMERDTLIWFYRHYIACDADFDNPYLFPARTRDFSAFPPTFLLTAEYDPLRDEGEIFAKNLKEAGVETVSVRYDGMIHGFSLRWALFDRGYDSLVELSQYFMARLL